MLLIKSKGQKCLYLIMVVLRFYTYYYYNLSLCAVLDRMKAVSLTSFRDHVAGKHEDRDKGFESEYQVWKYQGPAVDVNKSLVLLTFSVVWH